MLIRHLDTIRESQRNVVTPGWESARMLLRAGGWTPVAEWTDPDDWFALILCEAQPLRVAP